MFPPHLGMRQYWRDLDSLERWTRSEPHRRWWQQFLKDSGGTGFWHEAYFMSGGAEAIYDDMDKPTELCALCTCDACPRRDVLRRNRAGRSDALTVAPVISEQVYYAAGRARDAEQTAPRPADS